MPCMRGERDSRPRNYEASFPGPTSSQVHEHRPATGYNQVGETRFVVVVLVHVYQSIVLVAVAVAVAGGWPLAAGDGDGDGNDDGGDDADYHD